MANSSNSCESLEGILREEYMIDYDSAIVVPWGDEPGHDTLVSRKPSRIEPNLLFDWGTAHALTVLRASSNLEEGFITNNLDQ